MILISTNGCAIANFPCRVYIDRREELVGMTQGKAEPDTKTVWAIVADDMVMGKYSSPMPAKMELGRMRDAFNRNSGEFEFLKEE